MSNTFNQAILVGHLGSEPEVFQMGNKPMFVRLSLATNRTWKKDGAKQQRTDWHTILLYGATAEAASKFLCKGEKILVQGELRSRQWEGKDGQKHHSYCLVGERWGFMNPKASHPDADGKIQNSSESMDVSETDIPDEITF